MSTRQPGHVFFYGTLMRGFDLRGPANIDQLMTYRGCGTVPGRLYDVGAYPALVSGTGRPLRQDLFQL